MATTGGIARKVVQKNRTTDRSGFYEVYEDPSAGDIDLYAEGPMDNTKLPCAEIQILGEAGVLVVERIDGTEVSIPIPTTPWALPIEARAILDSSTVTDLLVLW